jgi:hypothetical protein
MVTEDTLREKERCPMCPMMILLATMITGIGLSVRKEDRTPWRCAAIFCWGGILGFVVLEIVRCIYR